MDRALQCHRVCDAVRGTTRPPLVGGLRHVMELRCTDLLPRTQPVQIEVHLELESQQCHCGPPGLQEAPVDPRDQDEQRFKRIPPPAEPRVATESLTFWITRGERLN